MKLHLLQPAGCHLHKGLHSFTGPLSQVNTPGLNPSQRPVVSLFTPEGWKAELT